MDVLDRTRQLYASGKIETALIGVREACSQEPGNAEAWWLLGCVARHSGLINVSDDAFRRAAELSPRQRPEPHRVTRQRFSELVEEAKRVIDESEGLSPPPAHGLGERLRSLPEEAHQVLPESAASRRWGILVPGRAGRARPDTEIESLPSPETISAGLSPHAQSHMDGRRMVLYQVNCENAAGSDRDLVQLIVRNMVFADLSRTPPAP